MKPWYVVVVVGLLVGGGALWLLRAVDAQRPKGSDQAQIRALIAEGARSAMQRDASGIGRLVSNDYKDGHGFRAPVIRQQTARILNQSRTVKVYIPANSIAITVNPDGKHASAQFLLQFQASGSKGDLPFSGTLNLDLAKEPVRYYLAFPGEEWRVTSAEGYTPDFLQ